MECQRSCVSAGVLGPIPGVIGCMQAAETIKWLISSVTSTPHLIGKQVYYDAYSSEPTLYDLPGKDPLCIACGHSPTIRSMLDTQAFLHQYAQQTSTATPLPWIPDELRISPIDYAMITTPHILLDVRPKTQFSTVAIASPYIINIPNQDMTKDIIAACIADFKATRQDASDALPIYVICNRGNESIRAMKKLLDWGFTAVLNIEGGLEAWRQQVDHSLPNY